MPLPLSALMIGIGGWMRLRRAPRAARMLFIAGMGIVLAATLNPVGRALLLPLESRYPAILNAATLQVVPRYVVVLGSGYRPRDRLPVTAALGSDALVRLSEGIRLHRQLPGAWLVLSGGPAGGNPPVAAGYALAAIALGVPPSSIVVIDTPRDTAAEIRAIHARVGDALVLLVTSAAHMPRAIEHCHRAGVHALAAPTGNLADPDTNLQAWLPFPSSGALHETEIAWHEYLGLLALRLGVTS